MGMGTTNIREALRLLDALSDEAGDLVRSAEEEVAAIEQAARDIYEKDTLMTTSAAILMEAIAHQPVKP
jgi:hypothetical protein